MSTHPWILHALGEITTEELDKRLRDHADTQADIRKGDEVIEASQNEQYPASEPIEG